MSTITNIDSDIDFTLTLLSGLEDLQSGNKKTVEANTVINFVKLEYGVDYRYRPLKGYAGMEDNDDDKDDKEDDSDKSDDKSKDKDKKKDDRGIFTKAWDAIKKMFKSIWEFFFGSSAKEKSKKAKEALENAKKSLAQKTKEELEQINSSSDASAAVKAYVNLRKAYLDGAKKDKEDLEKKLETFKKDSSGQNIIDEYEKKVAAETKKVTDGEEKFKEAEELEKDFNTAKNDKDSSKFKEVMDKIITDTKFIGGQEESELETLSKEVEANIGDQSGDSNAQTARIEKTKSSIKQMDTKKAIVKFTQDISIILEKLFDSKVKAEKEAKLSENEKKAAETKKEEDKNKTSMPYSGRSVYGYESFDDIVKRDNQQRKRARRWSI